MSDKYITGNHRKTVGLGVISAKVQNGAPRQVQITCKSKSKGEKVKGAIATCNPSWAFYKADSFMDNVLGWGLVPGGQSVIGNWETFRVRTETKDEAKGLVEDIGKCMDEYADYVDTDDNSTPSSGTGANPAVTDPGNVTKSNNTTTYIIIGAAVVVIALLLWDRKKK